MVSHARLYLTRVYSCIPACLGRKVWETVAVIIDLHLYIELTMPKGKLVKSTSKSINCNVHNYFDWQSKKQNPSHQSYVRKLVKPLASQSALSTVSWLEKSKLDGSSFTSLIGDIRKARLNSCWLIFPYVHIFIDWLNFRSDVTSPNVQWSNVDIYNKQL